MSVNSRQLIRVSVAIATLMLSSAWAQDRGGDPCDGRGRIQENIVDLAIDADFDVDDEVCIIDDEGLTCKCVAPPCLRGMEPEVADGCYTGTCVTPSLCDCGVKCNDFADNIYKVCVAQLPPDYCQKIADEAEIECHKEHCSGCVDSCAIKADEGFWACLDAGNPLDKCEEKFTDMWVTCVENCPGIDIAPIAER